MGKTIEELRKRFLKVKRVKLKRKKQSFILPQAHKEKTPLGKVQ